MPRTHVSRVMNLRRELLCSFIAAKDHVSVAEQLIDRDETESDESSSEDDVSEEEADEALTNRYALLGNAPSEMI